MAHNLNNFELLTHDLNAVTINEFPLMMLNIDTEYYLSIVWLQTQSF